MTDTSVPLSSTEVVRGPGAESFARPTLIDLGVEVGGSSEDGYSDTGAASEPASRLVDPVTPAKDEPEQVSAEEAAFLAKIVGHYVGFGWGLMANRHEDKLGPIAETVAAMVVRAKPELAATLNAMAPMEKFSMGLGALVGVVESAAARVIKERNIRIPYQDEAIVGVGIGTATWGIVQEVRGPKQDDLPPAPPTPPPPPPRRAAPSWSSSQSAPTESEAVDERPAVRATVEPWT